MANKIRIIVEVIDENDNLLNSKEIKSHAIKKPETLLDLGYRHSEQIDILQHLQDALLAEQSIFIRDDTTFCPKCGSNIAKKGNVHSDFHAVFTDHKVSGKRLYCTKCNWKSIPSVFSLFGSTMHPDLTKLQCEKASSESYRDASTSLEQLSQKKRRINNHDRIKHTTEYVGNYILENSIETNQPIPKAKELHLQVDGGHVKSKEENERSFEVMTSVIFDQKNVIYSKHYEENEDKELKLKYKRGQIESKHCAASALSDNQKTIKSLTLEAAKKQGLNSSTEVIAICDGAENCWQVVDSIEPHCKKVTRILDWFHIGMKFKNIALKSVELKESSKNAKWHLWRGDVDSALTRLSNIVSKLSDKKEQKKINALITYLKNNRSNIINYEQRHKQGLCFTSQLAESNVESLINQRCKGKQHMRWTREGLHPLMQLRAAIASNDWHFGWEKTVCGATLKSAA